MSRKDQSLFKPTTLDEVVGIAGYTGPARTVEEMSVAVMREEHTGSMTGESQRRMAELHVASAKRHAQELISLASTIYPDDWKLEISERLLIVLFECAAHAYRVTELCGVQGTALSGADACRFKGTGIPQLEPLFSNALNLVRHAVSCKVGWCVHDRPRVFTASNNDVSPMYVTVQTDRHTGSVSVFGLGFVYLTTVRQSIKRLHPHLKF